MLPTPAASPRRATVLTVLRRVLTAGLTLSSAACATGPRAVARLAPDVAPSAAPFAEAPVPAAVCLGCGAPSADGALVRAVTQRVVDLKLRGGVCEAYGSVLERSLITGRIVVRPFMWRVGAHLASAQAHSSGEIDVARDIDPLNSGVWTLDDVLHSMEHEAAHIVLAVPSGVERNEAAVNERVAECRSTSVRVGMTP